MKKTIMNTKYIWLLVILLGFTACNDIEDVLIDNNIDTTIEELPALSAGSADFSKFVALGASFSAGYTDGALFIQSQENSFPNMLAQQFANIGGGSFTQPLMNDNIGGLIFGTTVVRNPRLYFDGKGPALLPATPTTDVTANLGAVFNNVGVPGAKSTHIDFNGYASLNAYFGRMATSASISMLEYAIAQNPTFFSLSEIGGNDVLGYATSGGDGTDPLTPTATFDFVFNDMVNQLTAVSPKGVVTNVPYVKDLPHFTTVPYAPLSPTNPSFGPLIPTLNGVFGQLNLVYAYLQSQGVSNATARSIVFSTTAASAVVIKDETLTNLSAQIEGVLNLSPTFPAFVQSFGLPVQAAPLVANLLGTIYGQTRQATATDLLVLPSSSIIGTVNTTTYANLLLAGLPPSLAGQFSVEGVTNPLADKWVLLPSEQLEIKTATDAYNATIASVAASKGLALVDLNAILTKATTTGFQSGNFTLTTKLVTGGLVSLDGIHLTARGYTVMANEFLKAIDATYGSNFVASGNVVKTGDYPTNYSPALR
ncbi:MAG: hypothetical protein ACI9OE_002493 [Mariniflexile sp.]|jgi:hypothetical protein